MTSTSGEGKEERNVPALFGNHEGAMCGSMIYCLDSCVIQNYFVSLQGNQNIIYGNNRLHVF